LHPRWTGSDYRMSARRGKEFRITTKPHAHGNASKRARTAMKKIHRQNVRPTACENVQLTQWHPSTVAPLPCTASPRSYTVQQPMRVFSTCDDCGTKHGSICPSHGCESQVSCSCLRSRAANDAYIHSLAIHTCMNHAHALHFYRCIVHVVCVYIHVHIHIYIHIHTYTFTSENTNIYTYTYTDTYTCTCTYIGTRSHMFCFVLLVICRILSSSSFNATTSWSVASSCTPGRISLRAPERISFL
jgi:hypothetical protein